MGENYANLPSTLKTLTLPSPGVPGEGETRCGTVLAAERLFRAFFRLVKRVMLGAMATLRQPFGIQEAYAWPCLPSAIQHAHASVEHGTRKRVTNLANALVFETHYLVWQNALSRASSVVLRRQLTTQSGNAKVPA